MKTEQKWAIGNGLELLDALDKQSATLIILDLPYYGVVDDDWDNAWKNLDEYLDWCKDWFVKSERCLKGNGSLYYFNSQYQVLNTVDRMVAMNTLFKFRQHITIDKGWQSACSYHGVNDGIRSYPVATEYLNWYTFQDGTGLERVMLDTTNFKPLRQYFKNFQEALGLSIKQINTIFGNREAEHAFYWNSTQWLLPTKETYLKLCELPLKNGFVRQEYESLRQEYESLRQEYESLRYPFNYQNLSYNVWSFDFYKEKRYNHPTQKPFSLIERIVLTSSNEGDLVIDPAMGTGTTYKVCKAHNRNFEGRELNPAYERDIISRAMVNTPRLDSFPDKHQTNEESAKATLYITSKQTIE